MLYRKEKSFKWFILGKSVDFNRKQVVPLCTYFSNWSIKVTCPQKWENILSQLQYKNKEE
jgi:hypothetical protein